MIKCPDVRVLHDSDDVDIEQSGREFKQASIQARPVERFSKVGAVFPDTTRRCFFILHTYGSTTGTSYGCSGFWSRPLTRHVALESTKGCSAFSLLLFST